MYESLAKKKKRPDLPNSLIALMAGSVFTVCVAYLLLVGHLPQAWTLVGAPVPYSAGVLGTTLMMAPYLFSIGKRSGLLSSPPGWFVTHVFTSFLGFVLLVVHSTGKFDQMPALLLALGAILLLQGSWSRIVIARTISTTFGSRPQAFVHDLPIDRKALASLIKEKRELLRALDSSATEALFSPNLKHWFFAPLKAWRYTRLANREHKMVTAHSPAPRAQRYWRIVHISAAYLFLVGIILHVVLVTFFAGYVAEGEEIHWWHIADWSFDWLSRGE